MELKIKSLIRMVMQIIGAAFLGCYAVLLGPLGVLKGPLQLDRTWNYITVLGPEGLLMKFVRVAVDWRVGAFDLAIAQTELIISRLEIKMEKGQSNTTLREVLQDLFVLLIRANLHNGRIDDAMFVVIRAKKVLNVDRLPGLAELNAKTAHLVRAGLAAGKLLDGGGLATLFVKSPGGIPSQNHEGFQLEHETSFGEDETPWGTDGELSGAKIIPFPSRDHNNPTLH